ncbi:MAG: peroxiredoxin [Betaproteobacteria bacterium]|nr:peroxiredoxin [Betaproteobacteria bacterium]
MKRTLAFLLVSLWTAIAAAAGVPAVGSPAPEFSLPDQAGRTVRLADFRGKWLVLYFYPKDDTPGCTEQACAFRDDIAALMLLGARVVGVSLDDSASHAAFAKKHSLPFPLLVDTEAKVSASYGAVTNLVVAKFAKRYTFLIDPQGRIARAYLNVDTARHSAEIIADLKRLTSSR